MTHPCEKIAVTKTHEMSLGGKEKWRRPWKCLRIGTWNVLTLYRPGASTALKQELEKVRLDLVALQEVRKS
jgi:hypothetical protein